jgi:hypothetical protein
MPTLPYAEDYFGETYVESHLDLIIGIAFIINHRPIVRHVYYIAIA